MKEHEDELMLNFNFSTILLFKCNKRKYADSFIKGDIFFNKPKNWIKMEENGNKGQGDRLEGTFISVDESKAQKLIDLYKNNNGIVHFNEHGYTYFRRRAIENLYATCFYGLNDTSFTKNYDQSGKAHYISNVQKSYFNEFSGNITEEEYLKTTDEEKPVVIFINNPQEFFNRIKKALRKIGVNEEEIIISPIRYIDKKTSSITKVPFPKELLLKDIYYAKQNEVRIIINSKKESLTKYMNENNGILKIDNIEDITDIYDYYFENMLIERIENKTIEFTLPKPELEKFENMSLEKLLERFAQISSNQIAHELSKEDKNDLLLYIKNCIKNIYDIDVTYDDNKIIIYNTNELVSKKLEELSKPYEEIIKNDSAFKILIDSNKYKEAQELINNMFKEPLRSFYEAKILEKQNRYDEAIEKLTCCIDNEVKTDEALSARSNCYSRIGKYELAINDLEKLQDKIGYNAQIFSNKGINYILLSKFDEAIKEFNKAISINEINPFAYYNRSVVYYKLKKYKQARLDIEKALMYDPNNKHYNSNYNQFYKDIN